MISTATHSPEVVQEVRSHSLISSRSILAEPPAFHNSDMCGGICFVPRAFCTTTCSNGWNCARVCVRGSFSASSGRLARIIVVNKIPTVVENQALQSLITNL